MARNGAIGKDNDLLWQESADQKHFRQTTMGCLVIMGRRTWDSLPARFRPCPAGAILWSPATRNGRPTALKWPTPWTKPLTLLGDTPKAFVMGGGELYALALPRPTSWF